MFINLWQFEVLLAFDRPSGITNLMVESRVDSLWTGALFLDNQHFFYVKTQYCLSRPLAIDNLSIWQPLWWCKYFVDRTFLVRFSFPHFIGQSVVFISKEKNCVLLGPLPNSIRIIAHPEAFCNLLLFVEADNKIHWQCKLLSTYFRCKET